MPIRDDGNTIEITGAINRSLQVNHFASSCNRVINGRGFEEVRIILKNLKASFPNTEVPIASIVNHYKQRGIEFLLDYDSTGKFFARVFTPLNGDYAEETNALSTIWSYDDETCDRVATRISKAVIEQVEFGSGAYDAFYWCLHEVMDNVPVHSEATNGYVEVQLYPQTKRMAVCVADRGIGIYRSLRPSQHAPRSEIDAITLALRENVTRGVGQGNGLWGLHRIVEANQGTLAIRSGRSLLYINSSGEVSTFSNEVVLDQDRPGTSVDFQLDFSQLINLNDAIGHTPVNLVLESFFDEETGKNTVRVADRAHGTGTRRAGRELRTLVRNLLVESSGAVLDFEDVPVVSSSFADEFLGKLAMEMGFAAFNQRVRLKGLSQTVQGIVDQAVLKRLASSSSIDQAPPPSDG